VARNQGAAMAKGDILFFMDADVTIHPDTLAKNRPSIPSRFYPSGVDWFLR